MRAVLAIACALLLLPLGARAAPGDVSLVAGTSDPVQITQGDRRHQWFRLIPAEGRLSLVAEGPVVLVVRVRVLSPRASKGILRIYRDEGPFSDNPYDLARDLSVVVETGAAAELNAASDERLFHLPVPPGSHTYDLAPLHGDPVVMRVTKAKALDPALAVAPERAVSVSRPEPVPVAPVVEPSSPRRPTVQTASPQLRERSLTVEVAPVREVQEEVDPQLLSPDLAFVQRPEPPAVRKSGPFLALRAGARAFLDAGSVASDFVSRHDPRPTGGLELGWDLSPAWSLSVDGGFLSSTRATPARTVMIVPVDLAVGYLIPLGERPGLRMKLAASGAWVGLENAASAFAVGGSAGLALEVKAGPGRVGLEARASMLVDPMADVDAAVGSLHSLAVLAGYRLEL